MLEDFRKRVIVSLILTVPILILSPTIQSFLGFTFVFPGSDLVLLILSTGVYAYGGYYGVVLTPAIGAALMSASTVIVAINARTLRMG